MIHIYTRAACLFLGILVSFSSCLSSEKNTYNSHEYTAIPMTETGLSNTFMSPNQKIPLEISTQTPPKNESSCLKKMCYFIPAAGTITALYFLYQKYTLQMEDYNTAIQGYNPHMSEIFLNQTTINDSILGMIPDAAYQQEHIQGIISSIVPNSECYRSFLNWDTSFWNHTNYMGDPDHGPSYIIYDEEGLGHNIKSNFSEWLTFIAKKGPCDFDALYNYVTSIYNATNTDPRILICNPNGDGKTMCCYSAYTEHSQPPSSEKHPWPVDPMDIRLRIVHGSGTCVQNIEDAKWQKNMGFVESINTVLSWLMGYN